jgi:hypothetical protein
VLRQRILSCDLFVLFWCTHSANSEEVENEYRLALHNEKDILPVILHSTLLPEILTPFQAVDFRAIVRRSHDESLLSRFLARVTFSELLVDYEAMDFRLYDVGSQRVDETRLDSLPVLDTFAIDSNSVAFESSYAIIGDAYDVDNSSWLNAGEPTILDLFGIVQFARASEWPEYHAALELERVLRSRGLTKPET